MDDDGGDAIEAAQAEIVRLQGEAAESFAESERLREELRSAAAARDAALGDAATLRAAAEASEQRGQEERAAAAERERGIVSRYRELALRAEPALPAELIIGDSIEAVDAAVEVARGVVQSVREQLESSAQDARVPAGAPARGAPDAGAMTPEQKIRFGLASRR